MTSGGENFEKRCRDFIRRKNRGISEILGGRRLKSPDRFSLYILAEGRDIFVGRIVDIILELAEV
jgi:hypothetical protein